MNPYLDVAFVVRGISHERNAFWMALGPRESLYRSWQFPQDSYPSGGFRASRNCKRVK